MTPRDIVRALVTALAEESPEGTLPAPGTGSEEKEG
jgi:hypothetical protein